MSIIYYFKNFHISEILAISHVYCKCFPICSSSHVSLTTILGGGDWQSRWNYPHLIDVETVTQ